MSLSTSFPIDLTEAIELGAITQCSVRVWVRQPDGADVPVRLDMEGRDAVSTQIPVSAERDWTGFADIPLPEPAPNARFTVVSGNRTRHGQFAPAPDEHIGFSFGFGSCHQPYGVDDSGTVRLRRATRIYPAIRNDLLSRNARLLLLLGDQIYADSIPPISVRQGLPGDADHPPPPDVLLSAYRRVTRGFFAEQGFQSIREAVPTLCMWDDHDIFNNWGSLKHESPLDTALFNAAARAFTEYQDARNPSGGNRVPPFDFFYRFGTAGFLLLDLRGARNYDDGRLLGRAQWERFVAFLKSDEAQSLHTLFVGTSVPVSHASRWLAVLFEWFPKDYGDAVRDRWVSSSFRNSRDELLEALFAWQDAASHRQVILLSGDIHEAEASAIQRRGEPGTIWQFTSSAFTSPMTPRVHRLDWFATRFPNLLEPRFRFERRFLIPRNNVGLVHLTSRSEGGHDVSFTVRAWNPRRQRLFDVKTVRATADL